MSIHIISMVKALITIHIINNYPSSSPTFENQTHPPKTHVVNNVHLNANHPSLIWDFQWPTQDKLDRQVLLCEGVLVTNPS